MSQFKGVIAGGSPETVQAGADILKQGGNAFDAAVAAAFASFVSEMVFVNIGAGGIATLHLAEQQKNIVYDFFSDMPSGFYTHAVTDFRLVQADYGPTKQPFYIGRGSVAIPGAVAGLCRVAKDYGSLPLPVLLTPAIRLAEEGVICSETFSYVGNVLRDIFMDTPESMRIHAPTGQMPRPGEKIYYTQLSQTLRKLGQLGDDYFYRGELAKQIVADQEMYGGLVTQEDLANYKVYQVDPIQIDYKGYTVLLPSPSSIGGALIAFTLKLLTTTDFNHMDPLGPERVRILAEAMRLTNIARKNLRLGPAGVHQFLDEHHIEHYHHELHKIIAGAKPPVNPVFPHGPSDTTHLSVIDRVGNMIGITTSAGEGAGFVVGDTGISLNNMLGEEDLHPDGFHQTPPGTRLYTMMSPTIVLKDNKPVLVLGTGGSTRIRSAIVQVISNLVDFNLSLTEAVNLPRTHFGEGILQLEYGISSQTSTILSHYGYQINPWPAKNMYFGGVHAVGKVGPDWVGVGDSRRTGDSFIVQSV